MALTYGFFAAVQDGETGDYDRSYNAGNFTEYFDKILGSGVCVYGNKNSMLVSADGMNAVITPGYLFINGCWLKNDADYSLDLSGAETGIYAVVARLDLSARAFTLGYEAVAESYTNALVLAYVTVSAGALAVTDTRADTTVCGKIDGAGAMANKIAAALSYINNDIPAALSAYESQLQEWQTDAASALSGVAADFNGQISTLTETIHDEADDLSGDVAAEISAVNAAVDAKTAEVDAALATVPTPAVGAIEFSAAGAKAGWLPCDGRYITSAQYPALVAALGKLSPDAGDFVVRSDAEIGRNISNGYISNGRLWVYSFYAKALYGVSLTGQDTVEIPVESSGAGFAALVAPSVWPICLTILDGTVFLSQIRGGNGNNGSSYVTLLEFVGFTGDETGLTLSDVFSTHTIAVYGIDRHFIPYVQREVVSGTTYNVMAVGTGSDLLYYWRWMDGDTKPTLVSQTAYCDANRGYTSPSMFYQKYAFNKKNNSELIAIRRGRLYQAASTIYYQTDLKSLMNGLYAVNPTSVYNEYTYGTNTDVTPIIGGNQVLFQIGVSSGYALVSYADFTSTAKIVNLSTKLPLPSGSVRFDDAIVYVQNKSMWFIFVGTGIIFTHALTNANSYGFLNTTDKLGILSNYGYMDYDEDTSALVIIGQDSDGVVKVATLDLTDWQYSDTGAYLPTLSSGGIPAYIKAVSS